MSAGSTPHLPIPPIGPRARPTTTIESLGGARAPAEEIPRPDERADTRGGRRGPVLLGVADVSGRAQVHVVETGELEEHPGSGLAAVAAVRVRVGTEPAVRERAPEPLVGPGEASENLGLGDLARRDARLVRHD